ncbi:MAG: hypothetical protein V4719_02895 [Planctomycetota bacterium]
MRSDTIHWSVLVFFSTCFVAFAQETSQDKPVGVLIDQPGDVNFQTRRAAQLRSIEIGPAAATLLRSATKSDEAEVALRARNALRQATMLPPEEQVDLRNQGQSAFYAGDYSEMTRIYRQLIYAEGASIDDGRWLGHACQLSNQWNEAAMAYATVIDRMDQLLGKRPTDVELVALGQTIWPGANRNALEQRAAIILLTARIQRFYLEDLVAAERTLRRIYRFNEDFAEPLDAIARKWRERIAEALQLKLDQQPVKLDFKRSTALRFPMMALHELAVVQQLNGNHIDALASWSRIHWTTREYLGHGENLNFVALQRLIQALPAVAADSVPAVTFLDQTNPTAEFNLTDAATLAKAYDHPFFFWLFALSAPPGFEFQSLEFTCDIELFDLNFGGPFECWTLAGDPAIRKEIGHIYWPQKKPPGRDKITKKYLIEPGTGLVQFRSGRLKDKFQVHSVKVTATLRPVGGTSQPAKEPEPSCNFKTEILPKGGSISLNQQPCRSDSTTYGMKPGRYVLEYTHPRLPEPRRYSLNFQSGEDYALFMNLDSPLTSQLTNLRGLDFRNSPSTNIVQLPDGRWLVVWCHGGLRFATSTDGVTWSEPIKTSDAALFHENWNTLIPSLFVDKHGTIWVAYFSNQLDIDQLNTGGYRLFLRSSEDGREWSAARPVNMPIHDRSPDKVQLLNGPNEKVWMLYRMQYAEADSPAQLAEFKNLEIPVTEIQRSRATSPHATIDAAGRIHLVWDHVHQTLYYSRRETNGKWCESIEIPGKEQSPRRSDPHLIIRDNRLALIYNASQDAFLRRGELIDGVPTFGEPIKIAAYTAPLIGISPLTTSADRMLILCGSNTVWTQAASIEELLNPNKD